jgi:hypothetical protein
MEPVLQFPSVTLCDVNPYKRSAIAKIPNLAAMVMFYSECFIYALSVQIDAPGLNARERLLMAISAIPRRDRQFLSTSMTDFLKQCEYNGRACEVTRLVNVNLMLMSLFAANL